jgi:hypothetical protein
MRLLEFLKECGDLPLKKREGAACMKNRDLDQLTHSWSPEALLKSQCPDLIPDN